MGYPEGSSAQSRRLAFARSHAHSPATQAPRPRHEWRQQRPSVARRGVAGEDGGGGKVRGGGGGAAKAGVGLIDIVARDPFQLNFLNQYQSHRSEELMKTIDHLNKNETQVFFASSGIDPFWKMQRKLKSPAYTTRLSDLPKIAIK